MSRPWAFAGATVALVSTIGLLGCQTTWQPFFRNQETQRAYTADQLRADLVSLANSYDLQISGAADEISRNTADRRHRKDALLWEMIVIPRVRRLAFLPDPKQGFLAMLIVSAALHKYLDEGEGKDLFGEQHHVAVATARALEDEAFAIGRSFLDDEQRKLLHQRVDQIVAEYPISGTFSPELFVSAIERTDQSGDLGWVLDIPMLPVRALTGVSEGAQAIHEFNDSAQYFADVAAGMPQMMRWETELLLYDVESRDTIVSALDGWAAFIESSQRFAEAAERLPEDFRLQTAQLVADLEGQQRELQRTLAEAQQTIADIDGALGSARDLAEPFAALADQVRLAGTTWTEALREIRAMQDDVGVAPEEKVPFDIRDYQEAAREIQVASANIRGLVADLHRLVDSPGLSALKNELDRVQDSGRTLIDLAAWRAAQVVVLLFVCLVLYRLIGAAVARREGG